MSQKQVSKRKTKEEKHVISNTNNVCVPFTTYLGVEFYPGNALFTHGRGICFAYEFRVVLVSADLRSLPPFRGEKGELAINLISLSCHVVLSD